MTSPPAVPPVLRPHTSLLSGSSSLLLRLELGDQLGRCGTVLLPGIAQELRGVVGIDLLRRLRARVAQHVLDLGQAGPAVQQRRRFEVPKRVRARRYTNS